MLGDCLAALCVLAKVVPVFALLAFGERIDLSACHQNETNYMYCRIQSSTKHFRCNVYFMLFLFVYFHEVGFR